MDRDLNFFYYSQKLTCPQEIKPSEKEEQDTIKMEQKSQAATFVGNRSASLP